ncbi:MAG: hypothetical protein J6T39_00055, partial [Clostridia bacterium]|nr:hypothetical protein [Clostridia bacterium]
NSKQNTSVFGLSFGEKAIFLCSQKRQIVFVSNSLADGIKLSEQMKHFGKTCKTIFSAPDSFFALGSNTYGENVISSVDAFTNLVQNKVDCLVVSPMALMQKYAKKEIFKQAILSLKTEQTIKIQQLRQHLINIGYRRVDIVSKPAEFSVNGDILTIYDILEKNPYKIEFFDDLIETISHINIETFKRIDELKKITIHPMSTFVFDEKESESVYKNIKADFESLEKSLDVNEAINLRTNFEDFKVNFEAKNFNYVQNYIIPYASFGRLTDYIDDDAIIVFDDVKLVYDTIKNEYLNFEELYGQVKDSGSVLTGQKNFYIDSSNVFDFSHQLLSFQHITTANRIFSPKFVDSFKSSSTTNYFGNFDLFFEDMKYYLEFNNTVVVFAGSEKVRDALLELLAKNNVNCCAVEDENIENQSVNISSLSLPYGAIFVEDKFVVVGTKELLKKSDNKKLVSTNKKDVFTMPKIGDYVVHETHGIGLCVGIEKMKFSDYEKDYIILEYAGGDKLYLPTEQIGLISAYVSGSGAPKLNKLGS